MDIGTANMQMQSFQEHEFRRKVDSALHSVKRVLDTTRAPILPEACPHEYGDKYKLAEFLTNTAIAAELNCLELLGVDAAALAQLKKMIGEDKAVTLRYSCTETCEYSREQTREIASDSKSVSESSLFGRSSHQVVTTVTEHFWEYTAAYSLVAFAGADSAQRVLLRSRTGGYEIMTSNKTPPQPQTAVADPVDVDLTWLLQALTAGPDGNVAWSIDREDEACRTPSRNPEVTAAMEALGALRAWCIGVHHGLARLASQQEARAFVSRTDADAPPADQLDLGAAITTGVFVPVQPFFEAKAASAAAGERNDSDEGFEQLAAAEQTAGGGGLATIAPTATAGGSSPVLPVVDANRFLAEQRRSLAEKFCQLAKAFPPPDAANLVSHAEATLMVVLLHAADVAASWAQGAQYIEEMLRSQLVAAVGKEVGPQDFADYMQFHNQRLYQPEFRPAPFCHAIRAEGHSPEGVLSIEGADGQPVFTASRQLAEVVPMSFKINAATEIQLGGTQHIHHFMAHAFQGRAPASRLSLVGRARQFSSFMLVVGKLGSASSFEPSQAIILSNKDELTIPLLLETLPTAAEFRDAIDSLSPEQQDFCKAFRAMQLEGNVFGVAVIQLKPALEKVLNLAPDSLTKQIKLTQDLLELFIDYQIPSDLLCFDAAAAAGAEIRPAEKLEAVRANVGAIKELLAAAKAEQLAEAEAERKMAEERAAMEFHTAELASASFTMQRRGQQQPQMAMAASCAPMMNCMPPPPQQQQSKGGRMMKKKTNAISAPLGSATPMARAKTARAAPAPAPTPVAALDGSAAAPALAAEHGGPAPADDAVGGLDMTQLPTQLDKAFDTQAEDCSVKPTTVKAADTWVMRAQKSLLSKKLETSTIRGADLAVQKAKAFDLLDALSRSGAVALEHAALHIVVAATHSFDKSLIETVVQDNINPIEQVERSSLIVAATIHGQPAAELVAPAQAARVAQLLP